MRTDDKWLKQIKDKVDSYEEPAPSFAWGKISTSLANAQSQSSKKIIPFYRKASTWVAAAAVLIGAFTFFLLEESKKTEIEKVYVAQDNYATDVLDKVQTAKEGDLPFTTVESAPNTHSFGSTTTKISQPKLVAVHTDTKPRTAKATVISSKATASDEYIAYKEEIIANEDSPKPIQEEEATPENIQVKSENKASTRVYDDLYAHLKPEQTTKNKDKVSGFGVHVGGSGGLFNKQSGVEQQTTFREASLDYFISPTAQSQKNQQILFKEGVPFIVDQEVTKDYKHRQPISFGLSYSYSLSERLALESGLVYTFISSEVTETMSGKSYRQKFNYLGVPVKVNWSFFNRNNLSLYAAAGGMIEIAVSGKIDGRSERPTRPQFSTQAGIGLMYKVADHVGLYIEPGASYYFNDGGKYETIRSEKPFNFNFNTGLRLTF